MRCDLRVSTYRAYCFLFIFSTAMKSERRCFAKLVHSSSCVLQVHDLSAPLGDDAEHLLALRRKHVEQVPSALHWIADVARDSVLFMIVQYSLQYLA